MGWLEALWSSKGSIAHTDDTAAWREDSSLRYGQYRLMEATGLSTFLQTSPV